MLLLDVELERSAIGMGLEPCEVRYIDGSAMQPLDPLFCSATWAVAARDGEQWRIVAGPCPEVQARR